MSRPWRVVLRDGVVKHEAAEIMRLFHRNSPSARPKIRRPRNIFRGLDQEIILSPGTALRQEVVKITDYRLPPLSSAFIIEFFPAIFRSLGTGCNHSCLLLQQGSLRDTELQRPIYTRIHSGRFFMNRPGEIFFHPRIWLGNVAPRHTMWFKGYVFNRPRNTG